MSQTWPADDTFDHGTPVYGAKVVGYLGVQPEAAGTDWVAAGQMSDAYGTGTCSMVPKSGDADAGNDAMGVMRRQLFVEDHKAVLETRLTLVTGTLAAGQFKRAAVFVRIQGGTISQVAPEEVFYYDVDCYAFMAEYLTSTTLRFKLSRYNAGVETVLATEDGAAAAQDFFHTDVLMSLQAITNGSQVDLIARVSGVNVGGGGLLPSPIIAPGGTAGGLPNYGGTLGVGTEVPGLTLSGRPGIRGPYTPPDIVDVITFSDTNVSRLTGTGRAGFAIDRPRDHGTNETAGIAGSFQVEDLTVPATPVIVWRDEFVRAAPSLGLALTDILSTSGNDIGSDYSSDGHSATADADMLSRDTSQENAEQTSLLDFGKGIEFDGTNGHSLEHNNPDQVFASSVQASNVELTVCCWANLHTNRDGHIVFGNLYAATPFEGFECAIGSGTGANFKMRMRLGGAASLLTVSGDDFAELLNQRVFFAWTYKANANTPTGQGRVNFWYGLAGAALVDAGEVITISSSQRPLFQTDSIFYLGRDINGTPGVGTLMDGVLDQVTVFNKELLLADLEIVADPLVDIDDITGLGLVHQLDFEEQIAGTTNFYRPNYPLSVSDANSWEEDGSPDPVWSTGLKPTGEPLIHWAQRPVTNPVMQVRSLNVQYDGAMSVAGIILRGSVTADPLVYSGYRLEVGPGTPARIDVFRVIGGVASKLARQPSGGSINVSTGIFTKIEFSVDEGLVPTGPVVILAEINDVAVAFEAVGNGALIDSNNRLLDNGASRILFGGVEGFVTATDTLPTLIDDWLQGTVVPPAPDPSDSQSLLFINEFDLVSGTSLESVLAPDWAITLNQNADRVTIPFDSGHRQRIVSDTYARRTFQLSKMIDGDASELGDLTAFWDVHRAGDVAFDFDPRAFAPTIGPAGIFIFPDRLAIRRVGRHWSVQFSIQEKLGAS